MKSANISLESKTNKQKSKNRWKYVIYKIKKKYIAKLIDFLF
jgi:hypothetical protein